jgi:probable selenium-dependent hydroxylase accessory protein YqeC
MIDKSGGRREQDGEVAHELLDVLCARSGVVCFVGAGGKKSTLYRLAAEHPGRVGVTATVHIPYFPAASGFHEVVEEGDGLLPAVVEAAREGRRIAFACPSEKRARWSGVASATLERIQEAVNFDLLLVKADGARARLIKAPEPGEPQLPPITDTVIAIVSARAIGEALDERIAHRVDRVAQLCGSRAGEKLTPDHVGKILAETGELAGRDPGVRIVPVINMVDDGPREQLAREAAIHALRSSTRFDYVALTCMTRPEALVAVVRR